MLDASPYRFFSDDDQLYKPVVLKAAGRYQGAAAKRLGVFHHIRGVRPLLYKKALEQEFLYYSNLNAMWRVGPGTGKPDDHWWRARDTAIMPNLIAATWEVQEERGKWVEVAAVGILLA